MKVPCPLPLQSPWSPAGYQVVEVGAESTSATPGKAPQSRSEGSTKIPVPTRTPWSPVGCKVVQVAEEKTPGRPRQPSPQAPYQLRNPVRKPVSSVPGLVLGLGAFSW